MSRHPLCKDKQDEAYVQAEMYVNYILDMACPKAITLDEIGKETNNDPALKYIIECLEANNWQNEPAEVLISVNEWRSFVAIKDELVFVEGANILLRGNRIVIPRSMQQHIINLAHEGHQGVVKTKRLLREKVWFVNIDKLAENTIRSCIACQAVGPENPPEPLRMTELPKQPWEELSADFKGPLSNGEYLLVIIDDYSRYPVVQSITSTSANAVIPVLDNVFSMFGIPKTLKTDNGPPFNSSKFAQFANYLGFHHRRVTPLWPRANGEAERMMRNLNKVIQTSHVDGKHWKQNLNEYLRN